MTEEENDDELLKQFFAASSQMQIADDGFTERVERSVETITNRHLRRRARLWTACCVVTVVALVFIAVKNVGISHLLSSCFASLASTLSGKSLSRLFPLLLVLPSALSALFAIATLSQYKWLSRYGL